MWTSKKKWNEMCNMFDLLELRTNGVVELEKRLSEVETKLKESEKTIDGLRLIHNETIKEEPYFDINEMDFMNGKSGVVNRKTSSYSHNEKSVNTNFIPDVTLEELARYVIDGKPITRKVMEENIKEYGRKE